MCVCFLWTSWASSILCRIFNRLTARILWRPLVLRVCSIVNPPGIFVLIFHGATATGDTRAQRMQEDLSWLPYWKLQSHETSQICLSLLCTKFFTLNNERCRGVFCISVLCYGGQFKSRSESRLLKLKDSIVFLIPSRQNPWRHFNLHFFIH